MVSVVVFEFRVMRCQPLRRALAYGGHMVRDCQRAAFPVPLSRGGFGCCV